MESFLAALHSSDLAAFIRASRWTYPVVNAIHILGIALAVGSAVVLDARILGLGRSIRLSALSRLLIPFALTGIGLAILAGVALFSVKPHDYAANPVFRIKMTLLVLVLINAMILRRRALHHDQADGVLRVGAVTSLILWIGVLFCGRFIAFVG